MFIFLAGIEYTECFYPTSDLNRVPSTKHGMFHPLSGINRVSWGYDTLVCWSMRLRKHPEKIYHV